MSRRPANGLSFLAAALVALLLAAAGPARAEAPLPDLQQRIDQLVSTGEMGDAFWGIAVMDARTGERLYARNADHLLMPASTNKLLTAATAISALGPDHRFRTTLYFDGEIDGSTMRGDLYIRGSGDPTFGSSAMKPAANPLRTWARRLARMGIERIDGRVVGDDDAFDDRPYAEGWDVDYLTWQASSWLGLSTSGLSYNDNIAEVRIAATSAGEPPAVSVVPAGYLNIENQATTSRYRGSTLQWDRSLGTETFTIEGTIGNSYAGTFEKPVHNPTKFTAYAFRKHLAEAGIRVEKASVRDVDDLSEKPDYDNIDPLLVHLSPPLRDILEVMNHESNNFYAEHIFRTFAYGGSTEGGEKRVKALLKQAGVEAEPLSIQDGSGLSRKDLVTAEAMTKMLAYMRGHPNGEAFLSTIAQGGDSESTLKYRMRGLPVRAKTGSLAHVRALAGYAETTSGRLLTFALFANNYTVPSYRVTQAMDRVVMTLTATSVS
ncbi:MAG: D-alanyl-D-alanine carboxypeptidase/D-alanyl-D-alanine-endopeptidase [Bacteroidetes bacterium QS_8_64_10]|nr:MAG: D-alanyl-D-alanine carboxypeptidase/D-alanyl-D-alanine-endopeptidase [Bacteroidetes bacterium QS_8_64_10]